MNPLTLNALAVRWLIGVLLIAAIAASSYWAGDHNRNNDWLARQAVIERDAHAKYTAEVKRGNTAAGAFIVESQALQSNFQTLTEQFNGLSKRVPLLARGADRAVCAGANRVAGNAVGAQPGGPEPLASGQPAADVAVLTAGAVWMWNSALAGSDQPAGACGAANTTPAACALETGATVDDAWANHTTNAQLCAEDRLVHRRLIEFLTRKPKE